MQGRGSGRARPRMIVVGAGSAGSVLAARAAERFDVVVVEAGGRGVERVVDGAPHDGTGSSARRDSWSLPAELTSTRQAKATPGRVVGGSSVTNGGYFAAPEQRDLDLWHTAGGEAWSPERVRARISSIGETLAVRPSPQTHPVAAAFAAASGLSDLATGLLPLATTIEHGVARNVAEAYLAPSAVEVRTNCRALRVVVEGGRAVGVEIADGDGSREVLRADEVVLTAGAFGTARLLLASGMGPADSLRRAGIAPVADLPGVGARFSDHPSVWVEWVPTGELVERSPAPEDATGAFPIALRIGAEGGEGDDLEILACTQRPDPRATSAPTFGVIVGLQRPRSRGTVGAASAHPLAPPRIDYAYLQDPSDRAALREGVRCAARLLTSSAFAALVEHLVDLDDATLGDDRRLDAWIEERLASASHTCGTAPMGPAHDALAVTDGAGRVRGVAGLRIADTSLLPVVPSRATAAAAMAVGAIIADQLISAD